MHIWRDDLIAALDLIIKIEIIHRHIIYTFCIS